MNMNQKNIVSYKGHLYAPDELLRVEETDKKTLLIFTDGKVDESVLSIDVLEWELPKNDFVRIHPKHLINKNYQKKVFTVHTDWMELENGEKIPISAALFQSDKPKKKFKIGTALKQLFKSN